MIGLPVIHGPRYPRFVFTTALATVLSLAAHAGEPGSTGADTPAGAALAAMKMPVRGGDVAPIAAIYAEDHRLVSGPAGPRVIMAIWRDGVVIWSADPEKGGSPYFTARLPSPTVDSLFRQFDAKGLFDDPVRDDHYFGPDASFTTLAICDGSHRLNMSSWHEHFERNGKLVALASGVTALNGRNRDQLLARESEEYRQFRRVWDTVRSALTGIVPKERRLLEDCTFTFQTQPTVVSPAQAPNQ